MHFIQKSEDSKYAPYVFNAETISKEVYFDLSDEFVDRNSGKYITRGLDVCIGEI